MDARSETSANLRSCVRGREVRLKGARESQDGEDGGGELRLKGAREGGGGKRD